MGSDQKQSDDEMRRDAISTAMTPAPEAAEAEANANLPPEAQGLIGHQLRQEYRKLLSEPLPDKFTKLLDELAKSEPKA
jgi:hypothetical protein